MSAPHTLCGHILEFIVPHHLPCSGTFSDAGVGHAGVGHAGVGHAGVGHAGVGHADVAIVLGSTLTPSFPGA